MLTNFRFKGLLCVAALALSLAACSDSSTEIASPGTTGPNPGTGTGGTSGGSSGGSSAGNCPTGTTAITVGSETYCELATGAITSDLTLTADNIYHLASGSNVFVGEPVAADGTGGTPVTLTIEAGTVIYADSPETALVVTRGSKIEANGTSSDPIIFTSARDLGIATTTTASLSTAAAATEDTHTAEWGGIVINGRATINVAATAGESCVNADPICVKLGEGSSGEFGGNNDDDSSGTLRYVQVRYSGALINAEDELNGIAFQGVGRGTTVDYVQVYNTADDCMEFFGGTVQVKHLVLTGCADDGFDWTDGFRGKAQFVIVQQNPSLVPSSDSRGIEADNLEEDNDATPRSHPMLANFTLIGAASSDPNKSIGDTGIVFRRGTDVNLYNTVVSNFKKACFDVDSAATYTRLQAGDVTAESTLLDCTTPITKNDETDPDPVDLTTWFLGQSNNVIGSSSLNGFVNGPVEAAVTAADLTAVDSFFDNVDYIGAVKDATSNWTEGWTKGVNEDTGCPAVGGVSENTDGDCEITGIITDDLHLTAGHDYILKGSVTIGVDAGPDPANPKSDADPATLTINAGVHVYGTTSPESALYITRGSKIIANGTKDAPIVFSAVGDSTKSLDTDTALWGGIVLNGRAVINVPATAGASCVDAVPPCVKLGEGSSGEFGGNDDTDSSGTLRYVIVKYAGRLINAEDELNGVAFQGVGSGTTVDYVQVHNAADDCMEFFGGTVQVKHLVLTGCSDDGFDWTDGFRGKAQHVIIVQNDQLVPSSDSRGIEADNLEEDHDATPRSAPQLSNFTLIGAGTVGDTGIVFRRGTAPKLFNAVVTNFHVACFDIDNDATYAQVTADNLQVMSTFLDCTKNFQDDTDDTTNNLVTWFNGEPNNSEGTVSLTAPTGGSHNYIDGATETAITATDPTTLDSFFDSVDYIGAVPSADADWTDGWTIWLHD